MPVIQCTDKSGRCQSPFFEDHFLKSFNTLLNKTSQTKLSTHVAFDFGELAWADLLELLAIAGAMYKISSEGSKVSFRVTDSQVSRKSLQYLSASNFFDLLQGLGIKVNTPIVSTTDPYAFYRFTNISNYYEKEDARKLIADNIDYYYGEWMASSQRLSFDKIINEALENCLEHAYKGDNSLRGPTMIAIRRFSSDFLLNNPTNKLIHQAYWLRDLLRFSPLCDYLEISIVDVGVGILHTIRDELIKCVHASKLMRPPLPSEISDLAALRFTLSGAKTTSSTVKEGKGYGLYKLKNHVQAWNGLFLIRTGRARLIYSPAAQTDDERDNLQYFPGTQIRIMLPITDRKMNVEYILSRESELK